MTNRTNFWSLSLGIASASSTSGLTSGAHLTMITRAGYVRLANGQYQKAKLFGSEFASGINQKLVEPTSNAKLHCNSRFRGEQITTLRMIAATASLPDELRSGFGAPPSTRIPRPLTEEQKRMIADDSGVKESFYALDNMAARRCKKRYDIKHARPVWQDRWAERRDAVKAGKCPFEVNPNKLIPKFDRNAFALYMAGGGKRISSIGDAVNAITTLTINSSTGLCCPTKDEHSIKHTIARCIFILPALAVLAATSCGFRAIIGAADESGKAELLNGLPVTETVGWFWLMPVFHGVALLGQLVAVATVDKSRALDVEEVTEAETKKNATLSKTSDMINAVKNDRVMRTIVIEGLNKSIPNKHRTNGVPNVWLKLEKATTPAELQKAIAEYLTEVEPAKSKQVSLFERECHVLKIFKLAENARTEDKGGKLDESGRNRIERKSGEFNEYIGKAVAKTVYRLSGKGKIDCVAKFARWIEKRSDATYRERRYQALHSAEGRIGHRYHPVVVRANGGPLSKALVNIGFFVRDVGRNVILSLDTNLARVIRVVVQHLWEKVMGSHASMIMCHTIGMVGGWLIVGAALVALSQGLELVFGAAAAAGMLTTDGPGFGVGFASLTFGYGLFAAAGGVFMLAGMGLAAMGL